MNTYYIFKYVKNIESCQNNPEKAGLTVYFINYYFCVEDKSTCECKKSKLF